MAINLWKLQKPTSYNPLPVGTGNTINVDNFRNYILTFKAKSPSSTLMAVTNITAFNLTTDFKSYSFDLNITGGIIRLFDSATRGDIQIDNIHLVRKPLGLPKRTLTPKRWFTKNLVSNKQSDWEIGSGSTSSNGDVTRIRYKPVMSVSKGKTYTFSWNSSLHDLYLFDGNTGLTWNTTSPVTLTNLNGTYTPIIRRKSLASIPVSDIDNIKLQVEEGTTATPYETYQLIQPRAKTGLALNGLTDYVDLTHSSMTNFDYETEFTWDGTTGATYSMLWALNNSSGTYLAIRNTDSKIFISTTNSDSTLNSQSTSFVVSVGVRYKVKYVVTDTKRHVYVNDILIFTDTLLQLPKPLPNSRMGALGSTLYFKGAIHKAKLKDVFTFDFENPNNIVGDKVIPNAKNLIPSFEDSNWSLHANTQVLGKDVLRLNASAGAQNSFVIIESMSNQQYRLATESGVFDAYSLDVNNVETWISFVSSTDKFKILTTPSSCKKIKLRTSNNTVGTFDFIKPQLYELGNAGTLFGKPVQLNKASKRNFESKR